MRFDRHDLGVALADCLLGRLADRILCSRHPGAQSKPAMVISIQVVCWIVIEPLSPSLSTCEIAILLMS